MKVAELEGAALDYWVAKADGVFEGKNKLDVELNPGGVYASWEVRDGTRDSVLYTPSTNWGQGGPIIEREGIQIAPYKLARQGAIQSWAASYRNSGQPPCDQEADAPLVAAMRAFVASRFGKEVTA